MENSLLETDFVYLHRAIELALEAEDAGNLPIGSVISFDGRNVAEGKNAIWVPEFNPIRHAEMEALLSVPRKFWEKSGQLTLYKTLEPCLMCAGAILQHGVGRRVVIGSSDTYGGAGCVFGQMPPYFEEQPSSVQWLGPALPEECDPLYHRVELLENSADRLIRIGMNA